MDKKIICAVLLIVGAYTSTLEADTIYLKNKSVLKGIVQNQDKSSVTIELEVGTMTIPKSDIDRVEISTAEENSRANIAAPSKATLIQKSFLDEISSIRSKRYYAVELKNKLSQIESKITEIDNEAEALFKEYEGLNTEFKASDQSDVVQHNNIVAEINIVNAQISQLYNQKKNFESQKASTMLETIKSTDDYYLSLTKLYISFKQYKLDNAASLNELDDKISSDLSLLTGEFKTHEIDYSQVGNEIIINCVINGTVTAKLVVDTGASLVCISSKKANELGMKMGPEDEKIELTLANGTKAKGTPIVFKSVDVNGMLVEQVRGVIMDDSSGDAADGLLGMSYLSNFLVKIDSGRKKLIIEEFRYSN